MTAKRFIDVECENDGVYLWKDKDDVEYLNEEQLCELLNTLHEENEQLKQRINVLDDQITAQGIVIEGYQNRNQKLFDENKHIKQTIHDMMENERTELGQSILKQLWEQIQ